MAGRSSEGRPSFTFAEFIRELESQWTMFNRLPMGVNDLLKWANRAGLLPIADRKEEAARLMRDVSRSFLFYNPICDDDLLAFALAREIGRFYLNERQAGPEHDWAANVVAHLSIYPTRYVHKTFGVEEPDNDLTWNVLMEITSSRDLEEYDERFYSYTRYLKKTGALPL
ncbi:MAG: hypothetical protein M0017_04735 [Desulfobacteraceae bacterium]|nr:hypothetical protein [Desulfobacteraceae bacterium]